MTTIIDWYSGRYYNDEFNLIYEAMCDWACDDHDPDEYDIIDVVAGKEAVTQ